MINWMPGGSRSTPNSHPRPATAEGSVPRYREPPPGRHPERGVPPEVHHASTTACSPIRNRQSPAGMLAPAPTESEPRAGAASPVPILGEVPIDLPSNTLPRPLTSSRRPRSRRDPAGRSVREIPRSAGANGNAHPRTVHAALVRDGDGYVGRVVDGLRRHRRACRHRARAPAPEGPATRPAALGWSAGLPHRRRRRRERRPGQRQKIPAASATERMRPSGPASSVHAISRRQMLPAGDSSVTPAPWDAANTSRIHVWPPVSSGAPPGAMTPTVRPRRALNASAKSPGGRPSHESRPRRAGLRRPPARAAGTRRRCRPTSRAPR